MFNTSRISVLGRDGTARPRRELTAAVYGNGPLNPPTVPATYQQRAGVVVMVSPEVVAKARETLTQAEKDELAPWTFRMDIDHANVLLRPQTWGIPVWAGEDHVWVINFPAIVWDDPTSAPPQKVRDILKDFWRVVQ